MSNHVSQRVIAIFDTIALADEASKFLRVWEQSHFDVRLGTMSIVYETSDGQIKVRDRGPRHTLQGAQVGMVLGMLAGSMAGRRMAGRRPGRVLLPGATGRAVRSALLRGALRGMFTGALVGAMAGSVPWQEPDLSPDELKGLHEDLAGGKAGLIIRLEPGQVGLVAQELTQLDGHVKGYDVPSEAVQSDSILVTASAV